MHDHAGTTLDEIIVGDKGSNFGREKPEDENKNPSIRKIK